MNEEVFIMSDILADHPLAGKFFYNDAEIGRTYRALSTKHYQIIYTVMGNVVTIITLWNNNKDPKGLFKLLSK